MAVESCVPR